MQNQKSMYLLLLFCICVGMLGGCKATTVEIAESVQSEQELPTQTPIIYLTQPQPSPTEEIILPITRDEFWLSNGGCNLPCWWTIEPGVTTLDEVSARLESFDWILNHNFTYPNDVESYSLLTSYDPEYPTNATSLFEVNGVIERISIHVDSSNRIDLVKRYTYHFQLENIADNLGTPSRIWFEDYSPRDNSAFSISLFYDELGVLITYYGSSKEYLICPNLDDGTIFPGFRLLLQDPANPLPLEQFVEFYWGGFNHSGLNKWGQEAISEFSSFLLSKEVCF